MHMYRTIQSKDETLEKAWFSRNVATITYMDMKEDRDIGLKKNERAWEVRARLVKGFLIARSLRKF